MDDRIYKPASLADQREAYQEAKDVDKDRSKRIAGLAEAYRELEELDTEVKEPESETDKTVHTDRFGLQLIWVKHTGTDWYEVGDTCMKLVRDLRLPFYPLARIYITKELRFLYTLRNCLRKNRS